MAEAKTASIYTALLEAQKKFETLKKTETADTGKFTYRYVDLEAVLSMALPILHEHGLVMTQTTDIMGDMPVVVTTITHAETAESVYGSYPLVTVDPHDPQKLGGSLTYARRYALMALLGIATEDDDALKASTPRQTQRTTQPPTNQTRRFDQDPDAHSQTGPHCPVCGGEMWDNRPKKASGEFSPAAPDFKCKDKTCDGVIWPPKPSDAKDDINAQTTQEGVSQMDAEFASLAQSEGK